MAIQAISQVVTPQPTKVAASREPVPATAVEDAHPVQQTSASTEVGAANNASQPSREQIDQAMSEVKKAISPVARNLQFSIDDETGRSVVKVIDSVTKEVIRQIPSQELLNIARSMDKFSGLFVKHKA